LCECLMISNKDADCQDQTSLRVPPEDKVVFKDLRMFVLNGNDKSEFDRLFRHIDMSWVNAVETDRNDKERVLSILRDAVPNVERFYRVYQLPENGRVAHHFHHMLRTFQREQDQAEYFIRLFFLFLLSLLFWTLMAKFAIHLSSICS
jgi:hypothetical protein